MGVNCWVMMSISGQQAKVEPLEGSELVEDGLRAFGWFLSAGRWCISSLVGCTSQCGQDKDHLVHIVKLRLRHNYIRWKSNIIRIGCPWPKYMSLLILSSNHIHIKVFVRDSWQLTMKTVLCRCIKWESLLPLLIELILR